MGLHSIALRILPYIERWLSEENAFPALVQGLRQLHLAYSAQTCAGSTALSRTGTFIKRNIRTCLSTLDLARADG